MKTTDSRQTNKLSLTVFSVGTKKNESVISGRFPKREFYYILGGPRKKTYYTIENFR